MNKILLVALIPFFLFIDGCTVKYSFTGASISPELQTASVDLIINRTALAPPNLGQEITDELKDKIQNQTRLIIVNDIGDAHFEGQIMDYRTEPTTIKANEQAAQNRLTLSVTLTFSNSIQPELDFKNSRFSHFIDYPSEQSLSDVEDELLEPLKE
ncbi:LPS assembly lipoprotein LptE, partial [Bacteroidota bacterium]